MSQRPQVIPMGMSKKEKKNQKMKEKGMGSGQQMPKIKQKTEDYESFILDDTIFIKMQSFLSLVQSKHQVIFVKSRSAKQCVAELQKEFDKFLKKDVTKPPCLLAVEQNISKLITTVQIFKREHLGPQHSNKYRQNYRIYENQKSQIVCLCTFEGFDQNVKENY